MSRTLRGPMAVIGLALAVVVGVVAYRLHSRTEQERLVLANSAKPDKPTRIPPQTAPARKPDVVNENQKRVESTYMDVVRATYPTFPTTQPLSVPLDLSQAARIVLKDPVYLSRLRGDLWITRDHAPPVKQALHDAIDPNSADPQTHVLNERVVFVHWMPTDSGTWLPYLVCPKDEGGYEVIWENGRAALPANRDYRWDKAFSWNQQVVVPSRAGISVFHFGPSIVESYRQLIPDPPAATQPTAAGSPQALLDWQGLIAWAPWERGASGSQGAARYLNGNWAPLGPEQGWPQRIAYLVPLRDGTVFQFVTDQRGAITVQTTSLDQPAVDEAAIERSVAQLADVDQDVRYKAVTDLANFGPGAWPVLEKLRDRQPPQAKLLIGQLLKDRNHPSLSGMTLLGRRELSLVSHLSDGGVVFFAEQGVSIPEADDQTTTIAPAWISVRPGHYVELLSPAMVIDLKADTCQLEVVADQWLVNSDERGPRLFYGNGLATLLRKDEQSFSQVIGMDQMGRWLFREGNEATARTLVIDPHLPDPTPRLPVWQLAIAETVGWDKDNWPAVKNGSIYALTEGEWKPVEKEESFITRLDPPPATAPVTTASASEPAGEPPILKARDGSRFFDGLTELRMVEPDGRQTTWPLPPTASGTGPAWLIEASDGRLFLFNQPGRVLRIARTPGDFEPFKLEATFSHNVPSIAKPTRIWLDPAGRIDIAWGARLAILFPQGYIPQPIMQKITDRTGLDADGL